MGNIMKSIGSIFAPKMPKMPKAEMPMAMPDPAAPAAKLMARKKIEERQQRGRSGTIYTGGSYSNQSLGGTS